MTQRVIPILSDNFIADTRFDTPPDWSAIFGNSNPLALEIGCGTGHFVLQQALRTPRTNFIAIDIYNKGCLKTCAKIDAQRLDNVRVIRTEARWLLARAMQPESLAAVYINCPDPWPKKRHRGRRLVDRDFLESLAHYLEPGGDFYFSTDFDDYAETVAGVIHALEGYRNMLGTAWTTDLPGYPVSKYMQRFLDRGQDIYYIHSQRDLAVPRQALPAPAMQRGFRLRWPAAGHD